LPKIDRVTVDPGDVGRNFAQQLHCEDHEIPLASKGRDSIWRPMRTVVSRRILIGVARARSPCSRSGHLALYAVADFLTFK
jgi:hypothetical protein